MLNKNVPWMDGETVDPKEFLQKRRITVTEAEAEELIKCGQDGRCGVTFKNLKEWKAEFGSQLCEELQKDLERRCKENSVGCVAPIYVEALDVMGERFHSLGMGRPAPQMAFQNRRGATLVGKGFVVTRLFARLSLYLPVSCRLYLGFITDLKNAVVRDSRLADYVHNRLQTNGMTGGPRTTTGLDKHRDGDFLVRRWVKNGGDEDEVVQMRVGFTSAGCALVVCVGPSKPDRKVGDSQHDRFHARVRWAFRRGDAYLLCDELSGQVALGADVKCLLAEFPFHELEGFFDPPPPGRVTTRTLGLFTFLAWRRERELTRDRLRAFLSSHGFPAVAPTPGPGAPPAPPALLAPPAPAVPPAFAPMPPPPPPPITPLSPVALAAPAAHALVPTPRVSAFPDADGGNASKRARHSTTLALPPPQRTPHSHVAALPSSLLPEAPRTDDAAARVPSPPAPTLSEIVASERVASAPSNAGSTFEWSSSCVLRARADVTGPIVSCFDGVKLPCLLATMIEGSALMSPPARSYEPALEAPDDCSNGVTLLPDEGLDDDAAAVEVLYCELAREDIAAAAVQNVDDDASSVDDAYDEEDDDPCDGDDAERVWHLVDVAVTEAALRRELDGAAAEERLYTENVTPTAFRARALGWDGLGDGARVFLRRWEARKLYDQCGGREIARDRYWNGGRAREHAARIVRFYGSAEAREAHFLEKERALLADALSRAGAATYVSLCDAGADVVVATAVAYLRGSLQSSVPEAPSTDPWESLKDALNLLGAPLSSEARCVGGDIREVRLMRLARDAVERVVERIAREDYHLRRECDALARELTHAGAATQVSLRDAGADVVAATAVAYLRLLLPSSDLEPPATDPWVSLGDVLNRLDVPLWRDRAVRNVGGDIERVRLMRRARDAVRGPSSGHKYCSKRHYENYWGSAKARDDYYLGRECDALVRELMHADARYASLRDEGADADAAAVAAAAYLRRRLPSSVLEAPSMDPWASLRDVLKRLDAPLPAESACLGMDIEEVRLMRGARYAVEARRPREAVVRARKAVVTPVSTTESRPRRCKCRRPRRRLRRCTCRRPSQRPRRCT